MSCCKSTEGFAILRTCSIQILNISALPHSVDTVFDPQVILQVFFTQQQQQVAIDLGHIKPFQDILFDWQLRQITKDDHP